MLARGDLELARRDRALPGLALLLDSDAFTAAAQTAFAQRALDVVVGSARATYVRYKPGTSCLVAYRIELDGVESDLYARAYRTTAYDKLGKVRELIARHPSLAQGGLLLDHVAVAAFFFPNDRRLPVLARLTDEPARRRLWERLLPERPALWNASLRRLRYKPERRYVATLIADGTEQALLKLYTAQD
ncbi:MAG: hypothetical protein ACRDIB_06200, partial [Ardenticatenaceae bacterium]